MYLQIAEIIFYNLFLEKLKVLVKKIIYLHGYKLSIHILI